MAGHPINPVISWADGLSDRNREALLAWRERAPAAARAHPTGEHILPLFVSLGAAGPGATATGVYSAIEAGVLSWDAYRFDADNGT